MGPHGVDKLKMALMGGSKAVAVTNTSRCEAFWATPLQVLGQGLTNVNGQGKRLIPPALAVHHQPSSSPVDILQHQVRNLAGTQTGGHCLPGAARRRCRRLRGSRGRSVSAARAPWLTHFGLTATPFTKSVPAAQLCQRPALAEAVARINFVVASSGLGIVVGDVGVGKTVALRAAVAGLDPLRHHLIYLANPPALGTRGLHVAIVSALGLQPRFFRAEVAAQAAEALAAEEAERHRRVIVSVDLCRHRDYADSRRLAAGTAS
jgi:hypothetical protein